MLQDFHCEIVDKSGKENLIADHLSRLPPSAIDDESPPIRDVLPDEHIMSLGTEPWFADIVNYLATDSVLPNLSASERRAFEKQCRKYIWDDPNLFRIGADDVLRRCVPETEQGSILRFCHEMECGRHYSGTKTAHKVFNAGFFWPTVVKDAHAFYLRCDRCQCTGIIGKK